MGGQSVGYGSAWHLVLMDVEAAELLVLLSPGDENGVRRKLALRSANHGCDDRGGDAPPIWKPYKHGKLE